MNNVLDAADQTAVLDFFGATIGGGTDTVFTTATIVQTAVLDNLGIIVAAGLIVMAGVWAVRKFKSRKMIG